MAREGSRIPDQSCAEAVEYQSRLNRTKHRVYTHTSFERAIEPGVTMQLKATMLKRIVMSTVQVLPEAMKRRVNVSIYSTLGGCASSIPATHFCEMTKLCVITEETWLGLPLVPYRIVAIVL